MRDHTDLIARLEKLSRPDRETDARIYCAIRGYDFLKFERWNEGAGRLTYTATGVDLDNIVEGFPYYTASVDAALTLVPYHREWNVGSAALLGVFWAEIVSPTERHIAKGAATPAIALCIAALKALASLSAKEEQRK